MPCVFRQSTAAAEVKDSQKPRQLGLGEHLGCLDRLMMVQINAVNHCQADMAASSQLYCIISAACTLTWTMQHLLKNLAPGSVALFSISFCLLNGTTYRC